jgi:apolipoprotein N-acyltransferase
MNRKQTYLLAVVSAFIMWLAWPPIPFTAPLLLVGLVPLLVALNAIHHDDQPKKGKRIFLTAGLAFLLWNTSCIYWVYNSIVAYNDPVVSLLVSLIPYGLGALLMTFAFWLYYRLRLVTSKWTAYVGLICFYIGMEYLHQCWDLSFPWMNLGNGFAAMHQLVQWYEYTGVYGGTLWVLLSNILAFEAWQAYKSQKGYLAIRPGLIWLALCIIPIVISLSSYYRYEEKSMPINVVTVQPNVDPYHKLGDIPVAEQVRNLITLSDSIAQPNTEYFLWPETAVPEYLEEKKIRGSQEYTTLRKFISKYKNGNLITGIETVNIYDDQKTLSAKYDGERNFYYDNYNAAVQIENSENVQFYHKSKLVPGVEQMPFPTALAFLAPIFSELGGSVGGYGWQENPTVFYSQNGVGVDPVICYESIWGDWVRRSVKDGAQFVAIITNDAWWGNTSGKDQHLLYAKLRAIETRRWVVRSANTGISGFINQRGDIVKQSKWWTRTALKADINLNDEVSFYVKNGDIIAVSGSFIGLLMALIIPFKNFRRNKAIKA